ncbi:hypothetical protein FHS10_000248 [Mucilaginibacter dorajii]|nr:hypothetical protein [Mucilaginibacter dorajii]
MSGAIVIMLNVRPNVAMSGGITCLNLPLPASTYMALKKRYVVI